MAKFPEPEARAAEAGATPPQIGNLKSVHMHGTDGPSGGPIFPHAVHVHGKFYGVFDAKTLDRLAGGRRVLRRAGRTDFISRNTKAKGSPEL